MLRSRSNLEVPLQRLDGVSRHRPLAPETPRAFGLWQSDSGFDRQANAATAANAATTLIPAAATSFPLERKGPFFQRTDMGLWKEIERFFANVSAATPSRVSQRKPAETSLVLA